ncbi:MULTISPECIES: vitamin K epoxide reductase family protein [Kocuria]|uniref:vitamin K epoxide reductase family protein n=1 Tax=Kocuria TaxID=57493 RepID=UPI001EE7FCFD|nr:MULTISPECIES: vitamin K epoxide reductase family protein [Kocuria]MCT1802739.1 vitamin K epoxide reductase family protein [Kocuria carniphila]
MSSTNTMDRQPSTSSDRGWGILALILSIIGFGASATLVMERLAIYADAGHRTSCDINAWLSCGTVMRTPQAELFGFPNPFIGIVAYAVVIALALAVLAGARFANWYWWLIWVGILAGSVFTLWLWWQTTFEINTLCLYCMIVWCAQTILLVHTTARNARAGMFGARMINAGHSTAWAWLIAIGLLVIAFGIIAIRFSTVIFV